ncbi:hypothetical protein LIER_05961 [Lithospermum erythrorhizon]|uniref:Uncharacterized protein n=1 Tax=Lithospermum erythrorhizon TaxID=34254 RepID=A0AAV3P543_LITER
MVGYREDAYFLLEAYNRHFSKKLGFAPAIPRFKSRSRYIVMALEGLRYWRSTIITKLGQSVTFPSASKSHGSYKGYSDWLDSVFSAESIRYAPLGLGKGKSAPRLPSLVVSSLSKPLKKRSLRG